MKPTWMAHPLPMSPPTRPAKGVAPVVIAVVAVAVAAMTVAAASVVAVAAAMIVVAVVVLLWQTGIGQALRAAVGLIPRRARTEAALAAATLDPAQTENVREWISAKRAADPLFDVAFRAQQEKRT